MEQGMDRNALLSLSRDVVIPVLIYGKDRRIARFSLKMVFTYFVLYSSCPRTLIGNPGSEKRLDSRSRHAGITAMRYSTIVKAMKKSKGKSWIHSFVLYFAAGLILVLAVRSAAAGVTEEYEPNTEVTVAGKVVGITQERRGPVTFLLNSGDRFYYAVAGPRWYLREIGLALERGMSVEVTGSKMYGEKGNLHLVVYSIRDDASGRVYRFRDDNLLPLWRRRGRGMGMQ
jgi:hypothetical protein